MRIEPKFKSGDYIINRHSKNMGIVDKVTPKGYYHFKVFYGAMFDTLKDVKDKKNDLQINYQKFFELCTDEEKKKLDDIIKRKQLEINNEQSN